MPARFRLRLGKQGALCFIGHLDLARTLERAMRRAGLRLHYTEGFHPRARMQFASALPLGTASDGELVDVWIDDDALAAPAIEARLLATLPQDLPLHGVEVVADKSPSLPALVVAAEYVARLRDDAGRPPTDLPARIAALLAATSLPRVHKRAYDLRPLVLSLHWDEAQQSVCMCLTVREGAVGRPDEVLAALGLDGADFAVRRLQLLLQV